MDQNASQNPGNGPLPSAGIGNVPNGSEAFRTVRNDSEGFRNVPKHSERSENHTLTVREVARMFEAASVARTERSIINWCQPNKTGIARLDAYFDPNERKYFITPQSVDFAVKEEQSKAAQINHASEPEPELPKTSETRRDGRKIGPESDDINALEAELMDLKITNWGKDQFIKKLTSETEKQMEQLLAFSRQVGQLETRLAQLEGPLEKPALNSQNPSETRNGVSEQFGTT